MPLRGRFITRPIAWGTRSRGRTVTREIEGYGTTVADGSSLSTLWQYWSRPRGTLCRQEVGGRPTPVRSRRPARRQPEGGMPWAGGSREVGRILVSDAPSELSDGHVGLDYQPPGIRQPALR